MIEDHALKTIDADISHKKRGVLVVLYMYGRGSDIRFAVDSLVIIGFTPNRLDQVLQMTGRRSLMLNSHRSILITYEPQQTSDKLLENSQYRTSSQ